MTERKPELKMYTGYGAVVRINKDHPNFSFLMRIYIENLVYHGWDYENDDLKVFTLQPELVTQMDQVFVASSEIVEPINQDYLRSLRSALDKAVKDDFVEVVRPPQPLVWAYYE